VNAPLDPLSDFRSDGYGLDDARRARMRARVLDAIPDDAFGAAPVATAVRVEPWSAPDIDLTGAQALEVVPSGDSAGRPGPSRPHWSTGRRLLVAAAVAVAIGLMAVVAGSSRSSDRQVGTLDGTATKVSVDELASVAARQVDRPLAPGQYQYVQTTSLTPAIDGGFDLSIDDTWHTIDGSGRHRTSTAQRPAGGEPGSEAFGPFGPFVDDPAGLPPFGPFSYDQIRHAPTDPVALLAAVRAALPGQPTWAAAEQIAVFEALTATPPAVRAAGLKALALLGYQPMGVVTDPLGRSGVGFQAETPEGTEVLAFDPATGRALADWNSPAGGPATAETATRWLAWSGAVISDQAG